MIALNVKCPTCLTLSTAKQWNIKTYDILKPIFHKKIQDVAGSPNYRFVCPSCGVIHLADNLSLSRDNGLVEKYKLIPKYHQYSLSFQEIKNVFQDIILTKTNIKTELDVTFDDESYTIFVTLTEECEEDLSDSDLDKVYEYLYHPDEFDINSAILFTDLFGEGFFSATAYEESEGYYMIEVIVIL